MVSFEFYRQEYLGDTIPEKAFSGMAKKAQDVLQKFKSIYRVAPAGPESENMAICAMAESLYLAARTQGGVRSASCGSLSVSYEDGDSTLRKELYEKASIYLDLYRGVRA